MICCIEHYLQSTLVLRNRKWRLFYFSREKNTFILADITSICYQADPQKAKKKKSFACLFFKLCVSKSVKVNLNNTYFGSLLSERQKQSCQIFHHQVGKEDSLAWVQARGQSLRLTGLREIVLTKCSVPWHSLAIEV